jgi:ribonuclease HI
VVAGESEPTWLAADTLLPMPVVECDAEAAREALAAAGVAVGAGNTDHERWRAEHEGATAVAYDGKVVVQGREPARLAAILRTGGRGSDGEGNDREGDGRTGGRVHVYFDGASRGNPGPAAVGWVLVTSEGIIAEGGERIGETTNNRAEYEALVRAVEIAREYGFAELELRGDSQLVVRQVRGEWDANDPGLRERRVRVRELLAGVDDWSIEHVPRGVNERADELATEALDDG